MRYLQEAALAAVLALTSTGCNSFLEGNGIDQDPNNITGLNRAGPLYVGIQAGQAVQFQGQVAREAALYVQQVSGIGRQQIGFDRYTMDPNTIDPHWSAVYGSTRNVTGGGGLLDIHKTQQLARGTGDSLYIGIAKVYEALVMDMAADVWGDVPYREAADSTNETPAFDSQLQVHQDLLAQLDSAITIFLPATGPTNTGPPADNAELVYQGRDADGLRAVYTAVAHSLKARIYMHLAEVDPANYALALAEVPLGISSPADDFNWFADVTSNGNNIWWQFQATRAGDLGPGGAIIEILKRRIATGLEDDARLNFYFTPATDDPAGGFYGHRPGDARDVQTAAGIFNGNGSPVGTFSDFNFTNPDIDAGDFRQPEISYVETQLIGAEAALQSGGAAQAFLDAARAQRGYGARGSTPNIFPALGSAPATLQNIMEEKYVALFLNIESWNDYKRTCLPSLAPAPPNGTGSPGTTPIPGRLPYGLSELNANPNTPPPSVVPATGFNRNDPNPCPVLNYTSTVPLAN